MPLPHLPAELLGQIAGELTQNVDFFAFTSVSKFWRESAGDVYRRRYGRPTDIAWHLRIGGQPPDQDRMQDFFQFANSPCRTLLRIVKIELPAFDQIFESTHYKRRKQRYTFREQVMRTFESDLAEAFGYLAQLNAGGKSEMSPLTVRVFQQSVKWADRIWVTDSTGWYPAGNEMGQVAHVDKPHYQECKDYAITRHFQAVLKVMAASTLTFAGLEVILLPTRKNDPPAEFGDFTNVSFHVPCFGLTNETFRLEQETKAALVDKLKDMTTLRLALHLDGDDMGRVADRGDEDIVAPASRSNLVQEFIALCPRLQVLGLDCRHGSLADEQLLWWLSKPVAAQGANVAAHAPELFPAAPAVPACNLPSLTTLELENLMVTPETLKALIRKIPNEIDFLNTTSVTLYRHITPQLRPPQVQEWGSFWTFIKDNIVVHRIEIDQPQVVKCTDLTGGPQVVRRSRRHYDRKPYTASDYARGRGDDIGRIAYAVAYPPFWTQLPPNRPTNQRIQFALDKMGIKKYSGGAGVSKVPRHQFYYCR